MKGGSRSHALKIGRGHGFTIAETLIVLAVSGAMLLAAIILINGRQAHTEFNQGIQEVQSQLQQDMNDVANGYYPSNGSISCVAGGGGPILTSGSTERGANDGCIFVGKVLQFEVSGRPGGYNVYPIAGLMGGEDSLATAKPRLIAEGTGDPIGVNAIPDEFESRTLPNGLTVVNMYYGNNPASNHIGALGFITHLSTGASTKDIDVAAIPATSLGMTKATAVHAVNGQLAGLPAAAINPSQGIHICIASGGTSQSALLSIGGSGQTSSITADVKGGTVC